jgi:hypothetical protein
LKPLGRTLSTAPLSDLVDVDPVSQPDSYGSIEALSIVPVIEPREPIAAGIRRREKPYSGGPTAADFSFDWSHREIAADPEWAGRKFDEEACLRVEILVAAPMETNAGHHLVELTLSRFGLKDEIQVFGEITARCVDCRAGTSGEYRSNPGALQDFGHGSRDDWKRGFRCELQRRFPVRLGLRRSRPTRSWSCFSPSVSRSRYLMNSS